MAISVVFDGHVRNVGTLGLDVFVTFTIATVTEFPADTFLTLTLDIWGRRWLACGSMVLSGIFSLLATAVPLGKSYGYIYSFQDLRVLMLKYFEISIVLWLIYVP